MKNAKVVEGITVMEKSFDSDFSGVRASLIRFGDSDELLTEIETKGFIECFSHAPDLRKLIDFLEECYTRVGGKE